MENDSEAIEENGVDPLQRGSFKNHYWKFVGAFLVIIVLGVITVPFIGNYIKKEETKNNVEATDQLYKRDLAIREQLRNDTDGGKTPEETLQMFITALKANDIEKAKLYYSPYPENRSAMFKQRLDQLSQEGKISGLIDLLGKVTLEKDKLEEDQASYSYINKEGKLAISVVFDKAIQFSNIWKIEQLAY